MLFLLLDKYRVTFELENNLSSLCPFLLLDKQVCYM